MGISKTYAVRLYRISFQSIFLCADVKPEGVPKGCVFYEVFALRNLIKQMFREENIFLLVLLFLAKYPQNSNICS